MQIRTCEAKTKFCLDKFAINWKHSKRQVAPAATNSFARLKNPTFIRKEKGINANSSVGFLAKGRDLLATANVRR